MNFFVRDVREGEVTGFGKFYGQCSRRPVCGEDGEACVEGFSYGVGGWFAGDDEGGCGRSVACMQEEAACFVECNRLAEVACGEGGTVRQDGGGTVASGVENILRKRYGEGVGRDGDAAGDDGQSCGVEVGCGAAAAGDDGTFGEKNFEGVSGEDADGCPVNHDRFDFVSGDDCFGCKIAAGEFVRMVGEHENGEEVSAVDGQGECLFVEEAVREGVHALCPSQVSLPRR